MKRNWTAEENKLLIKIYPMYGPDCFTQFRGRTKASVYNHAQQLGLIYRQTMPNWTEEELKILQDYYPTEGKKIITRLPNRTIKTIQVTAHRMGLRRIFKDNI